MPLGKTSLALIGLLLAASSPAALASSPRAQIVDEEGDSLVAGADLRDVRFSTRRDASGGSLVVTLRTSGDIGRLPTTLNVSFQVGACARRTLAFSTDAGRASGRAFDDTSACTGSGPVVSDPAVVHVDAVVGARSVTWRVPLRGDLRRGARLSQLRAFSTVGTILEPPLGGRFFLDVVTADEADGRDTYVVGR